MNFSDLSAGDKVTFRRFAANLRPEEHALTLVADPVDRDSDGMVVSTLEAPHLLFEADGWEVGDVKYASGFPKNAQFVCWTDTERERRVASAHGHLANGVWDFNGSRMSGPELLRIIGNAKVTALDPRQ